MSIRLNEGLSTESQEPIKSVDWLNKDNLGSKFTPEVEQKLKNYLKQKYNIEKGEVINIAADELKNLKKQIELSQNPVETVVKFVFGEYIETKLEDWWIKEVSIENTTKWIKNERLDYTKKEVDKLLDGAIENNFPFLSDRKEMIKLVIVNKILNNPITWKIKNYLEWLTKTLEAISKLDVSKLWDNFIPDHKIPDSNEWDDIQKTLSWIIIPYFNWFEQIKKKFDDPNSKIENEDQKKNIISQMSYFNNPNEIEKWFNEADILKQIDVVNIGNNKDKDWNIIKLKPEEQEMLKKYMLDSREKIENTLKMWEMWDKAKDFVLSIAWAPWAIWKFGKWFIEGLLKIPFFWKIIALFLWLDPDKAVEDFNDQIWSFKTLKTLKSLWLNKDKEWKEIPWVEPFKDIDLSEINHNDVKKELKDLMKYKPTDMKEDEFLKTAFGKKWIMVKNKVKEKDASWKEIEVEKDKNLIFDLSEDTAEWKDKKIDSSEFKSIIKKWYEKSKNTEETKIETEKEQENKNKEQEEKAKNEKIKNERDNKINTLDTKKTETYKEIYNLNSEIAQLWKIISWEYKNFNNWNTFFNSLNWIKIEAIINHSSETFKPLILKQLWTTENSNSTSKNMYIEKYEKLFDSLFTYLKEYCKDKPDTHKENVKSLFEYNNSLFNDFLNSKKELLNKKISDKQTEIRTIYTDLNWLNPANE